MSRADKRVADLAGSRTNSVEKLFAIIHEDTELLVINKPAGLVCHPTKTDAYSSLISRARLYLGGPGRARCNLESAQGRTQAGQGRAGVPPAFPNVGGRRDALPYLGAVGGGSARGGHLDDSTKPHLINRLDRETSGVVLIAKQDGVARELRRIWETRQAHKEYLAIVHGLVGVEHGVLDAPLGKDAESSVAIKDCVRSDGAPSRTEFRVQRRFRRAAGEFTLLRVVPRTGRKHQIRIHLAHAGHPIVGDKLYGGDENLYLDFVRGVLTEEQRRRLILPNQALHAGAVRFFWRGAEWLLEARPEEWFAEFASDHSTTLSPA